MILSQILNALEVVRIQWILATLTPLARLIIVFWMVESYAFGSESVMWAAFIVSIPITIIAPILVKNKLKMKILAN
jgi:hypothetical protein